MTSSTNHLSFWFSSCQSSLLTFRCTVITNALMREITLRSTWTCPVHSQRSKQLNDLADHFRRPKISPCPLCSDLCALCVKSFSFFFRRRANVELHTGLVQSVAAPGIQNAAARAAGRNLV